LCFFLVWMSCKWSFSLKLGQATNSTCILSRQLQHTFFPANYNLLYCIVLIRRIRSMWKRRHIDQIRRIKFIDTYCNSKSTSHYIKCDWIACDWIAKCDNDMTLQCTVRYDVDLPSWCDITVHCAM
jgi:hypothetical protein